MLTMNTTVLFGSPLEFNLKYRYQPIASLVSQAPFRVPQRIYELQLTFLFLVQITEPKFQGQICKVVCISNL